MADQTPPTKPLDFKPEAEQPKAPAVKPLSADTEKELRGIIARLQEDLVTSQAEAKALNELLAEQDKARVEARAKKSGGPKIPLAKVQILGEGRRVVMPGKPLKQSELPGLVEGEHYELGDA